MTDPDAELVEAIRELTRTVEALRDELESGRRPAFQPPRPRDLFSFSEEVALPVAIAALESTIRALETARRGLEAAQTQRDVRDRVRATSDQATELRHTTLTQLETVLSELQRAAANESLPANQEASQLLADAKTLRDQIDQRLREATSEQTTADSGGVRIEVADGKPEPATDEDSIDVDAELETLKDRYAGDEDAGDDGADSDDTTSSS